MNLRWSLKALGLEALSNLLPQRKIRLHLPRSNCQAPKRLLSQGHGKRLGRANLQTVKPRQIKRKSSPNFKQAVTKPPSPAKQESDTSMTDSESEPSPSPVKKKKIKRHAKKKRRHVPSSDSETSEEDGNNARQRVTDHAALAKQVYENNVARYKSDVVYKSSFPYLQGA